MSPVAGSDCPTGKAQMTKLGAREQRDWWRRNGDPQMKDYRCPQCECWHLGHTTRRRERLRARTRGR